MVTRMVAIALDVATTRPIMACVFCYKPLEAEVERLRNGAQRQYREIEQTLGKALGYPYFYSDQKNFSGTTEADGVCVGEHVAESIAEEAARRIREQAAEIEILRGKLHRTIARP
jgi:translation initiation factor 2 alpha subunit (eIF-2alpha)